MFLQKPPIQSGVPFYCSAYRVDVVAFCAGCAGCRRTKVVTVQEARPRLGSGDAPVLRWDRRMSNMIMSKARRASQFVVKPEGQGVF